jgi:hypothetical protein
MGSHRHSRNLDDGCCFNVSTLAVPRRGSLVEPSGTRTKNKKAVAGLRTSATAYWMGMMRSPRSTWPKGSRMRLTSLGSAMPESHRELPTRYRHSFRAMRERRIIRGLDRRSPCGTRFLPKLRPPGRRALFSVATKAEPMSALTADSITQRRFFRTTFSMTVNIPESMLLSASEERPFQ